MKKAAILLLAVGLMAGQHAIAGDKSTEKKGEGTVERVGHEAGHGVERGANAAGHGIKRAGRAVGHGMTTAANWIERKLDGKHGGKKEDK